MLRSHVRRLRASPTAGNIVAASYRTSTRYFFVPAIPGSYYFLRPDRNVRPACGRGSRLIIFLELSSSPPLRGPQRRRRLLSRSSATRLCVGNQTLTGVDPFPPSVGCPVLRRVPAKGGQHVTLGFSAPLCSSRARDCILFGLLLTFWIYFYTPSPLRHCETELGSSVFLRSSITDSPDIEFPPLQIVAGFGSCCHYTVVRSTHELSIGDCSCPVAFIGAC